jgi:hypothetical protein
MALDFTTASLDSRVTFTRTGNTATVINSSGLITPINADLPRFDYTLNTGGDCKGLLIEEARTNVAIYSQSPTNWFKAGTATVSGSGQASPDGSNNAFAISACESYANRFSSAGSVGVTGGSTVTYSIYLKSNGNGTGVRLSLATNGGTYKDSTVLVNITSSWDRYSITMTTNVNNTGVFWIAYGDTGTTAFVPWGVQVEQGAFPTSYIPTVASQVTRTADVATMTGTNFSSWYTATTGAAVVWAIPQTATGTRPLIQFDDTTALEVIALRGNVADPELYIVDLIAQAQIDAGTIVANTAYKLSGAWNTNSCAAAKDGGTVGTDNTATIPTPTQLRIGSDGTNYASALIQKVLYYPQRIINAEIQAISK